MREFKNAFTLAEVLITLLIIGVISSIVIPGIINSTNEAEYNAGVKKAYADLSNALKMIQANNNGEVNVGDVAGSSHSSFRNDFCNVMTCVQKGTAVNIWGATMYKYYKGGNYLVFNQSYNNSAILNNGSLIWFKSFGACNMLGLNACGDIYVDINGPKGPNMVGKDSYWFMIMRKNINDPYRILPLGTQGDNYDCSANSVSESTSCGCTAQRLKDPEHMPQ
jgi:prepilin-type N-terminal cleavage/methylation domain-containing protein